MDISFEDDVLKAYKKAGGKSKVILAQLADRERKQWHHSSDISSHLLTLDDLKLFERIISDNPLFQQTPTQRGVLRSIRAVIRLKETGGKRITSLPLMVEALRDHLRPLKRHWVFIEEDGQLVPWFVSLISYVPPKHTQDGVRPAFIKITLIGKRRGKEEEQIRSVFREALGFGTSPAGLLEHLGFLTESAQLIASYEEEKDLYEDYASMAGELFLATGRGKLGPDDEKEDEGRYWRSWNAEFVNLEREGGPSRAIMDDGVQYGEKGKDQVVPVAAYYWEFTNEQAGDLDKGEEEIEEAVAEEKEVQYAPLQPFLCVFTLLTHEFCLVHVSSLVPYKYDATLAEKLVIPDDHRHLIDVLITTQTKGSEDLVRGKKGGVVILSSGPPGTGKTLTAEIYSEVAERPLYVVQCSQLGITAKDLEGALGVVLRRAMRWRAILLLDEADVYIHERGRDVNQNAIVGVFLRLLEYYAGVLFMTTNRAVVIDDAIHSRCMAHIRYGLPEKRRDRKRLWEILSAQYHVELPPNVLREVVEAFPTISGRSIKQLCRLVQALGDPPTLMLFQWLAEFQDGVEVKTDPKPTEMD